MATDEATAAMTTDIDEEAETMATTEEADVACVQTTLDGGIITQTSKAKRKSYTREYKLLVVQFYKENNLYQTAKKFSLNTRTIGRWVSDVEKIRKSKKSSKRANFLRKCQFPDVEEELYREYKDLRKKGLKVKGFWFRTRGKQLLSRLHPDASFLFSDSWFDGFKTRHRISMRRRTHVAQKPPSDKKEAVQHFHRAIRKVAAEPRPTRPVGRFTPAQIANMDQTPLPFCFMDGGTYEDTGAKNVWVRSGASGLEKRQCTAQITLFADGEPRVKPLLIFKGKGKRISMREKVLLIIIIITHDINCHCFVLLDAV